MSSDRNSTRSLSRVGPALFAASLLLLLGSSICGQSLPAPPPPRDPAPNNEKQDRNDGEFGSGESEMRAKLLIKAEKKEYDENLARAKEASDIATQINESYQAKKLLNSEDSKKLERLEKLTKRIRNEAGGSETDAELKDIPAAIESAVKRVAELADDLRKEVEKTPRHVVSAAVIDQANKLIGLVQFVRHRAR